MLRIKLAVESQRADTILGARLTCGSLTPSPAGKRYVSQDAPLTLHTTNISSDCLQKSRHPNLQDPVQAAPTPSRLAQTPMTTSLPKTMNRLHLFLVEMVPPTTLESSQRLASRLLTPREFTPPRHASLPPSKSSDHHAPAFTD